MAEVTLQEVFYAGAHLKPGELNLRSNGWMEIMPRGAKPRGVGERVMTAKSLHDAAMRYSDRWIINYRIREHNDHWQRTYARLAAHFEMRAAEAEQARTAHETAYIKRLWGVILWRSAGWNFWRAEKCADAWRCYGNGIKLAREIGETGREYQKLVELGQALVEPLMLHTSICPFGGGKDGERKECRFGHQGCECSDWLAGHELGKEFSSDG